MELTQKKSILKSKSSDLNTPVILGEKKSALKFSSKLSVSLSKAISKKLKFANFKRDDQDEDFECQKKCKFCCPKPDSDIEEDEDEDKKSDDEEIKD
jgi:hypothetical protein